MSAALIDVCRRHFAARSALPVERALRQWFASQRAPSHALCGALVDRPATDWPDLLRRAPAASHRWYDYLADAATLETFADFLHEESEMPPFVPLLDALGRDLGGAPEAAIRRNLANEIAPKPHAEIYRELLACVFARAVPRPIVPSDVLADTNLVFYYGYYLDPAFAVGALYATELLFPWRAERMYRGLRRLGFTGSEASFMSIHVTADLEDAEEWLTHVVLPLSASDPSTKASMAAGASLRLDTSCRYFERLSEHKPSGIQKENLCLQPRSFAS